jgi:hypothetical protein
VEIFESRFESFCCVGVEAAPHVDVTDARPEKIGIGD